MPPTHPAPPPAPAATPGAQFTRLLFALALALGTITMGSRLLRGARTGQVDWLELALPGAVMLMLGGVLAGPRRRWLYYPLLATAFALLVTFYVSPHRVRRADAPPAAPSARPAAAPAPAR
jgi:hypothetical protein